MGCLKSLTISGGCALEACSNQTVVHLANIAESINSLAYGSDICYACFCSASGGTTGYFSKYEPATNTVVIKATVAATPLTRRMAYDVAHQKFVTSSGSDIIIFDPITETVDRFTAGITPMTEFVYVPEKGRVYGKMGTDGTGLTYIGYVDLDLRIVVQLGTLPAVGGSKPSPNRLLYVPSTDCLYGCWSTGLGSSMAKFDLATNTGYGSIIGAGIEGVDICLDTDRNLIIVHFSTAKEVDPATETIVRDTIIAAGGNCSYDPCYSSTLKRVIGCGANSNTGSNSINSYSTQDYSTREDVADYPETYAGLVQFSQGSILSNSYNDTSTYDGVKRCCIS